MKYEEPKIEIILFDPEDIVRTSGGTELPIDESSTPSFF